MKRNKKSEGEKMPRVAATLPQAQKEEALNPSMDDVPPAEYRPVYTAEGMEETLTLIEQTGAAINEYLHVNNQIDDLTAVKERLRLQILDYLRPMLAKEKEDGPLKATMATREALATMSVSPKDDVPVAAYCKLVREQGMSLETVMHTLKVKITEAKTLFGKKAIRDIAVTKDEERLSVKATGK